MPEPLRKAAGLNTFVDMAKKAVPDARWQAFRAALSPGARDLVDRPRLAAEWVPALLAIEIYERVHAVVCGGDDVQLRELAEKSMRKDVNLFFRYFMHLIHPEQQIERVQSVWRANTQNTGTLEITRRERGLHELTIETVRPVPRAYFVYVWGLMSGAAHSVRVRNLQIVIDRVTAQSCVYRFTWEQ